MKSIARARDSVSAKRQCERQEQAYTTLDLHYLSDPVLRLLRPPPSPSSSPPSSGWVPGTCRRTPRRTTRTRTRSTPPSPHATPPGVRWRGGGWRGEGKRRGEEERGRGEGKRRRGGRGGMRGYGVDGGGGGGGGGGGEMGDDVMWWWYDGRDGRWEVVCGDRTEWNEMKWNVLYCIMIVVKRQMTVNGNKN